MTGDSWWIKRPGHFTERKAKCKSLSLVFGAGISRRSGHRVSNSMKFINIIWRGTYLYQEGWNPLQ
jgi:hypothetical protein